MWIIPKQLHTSRYVADMKGLGLDSEEFSQISEKSLMWRSKPSQSKTWLRRWKRVSWMQHLSSRILKPSHIESFVERYLSCQQASPVSHLAPQESGKQLKTPDIYSHTLSEESKSASQMPLFSRTSKELSQPKQQMENRFSNMSSEDWKTWVTQQRQEFSQRVKLERHIRESESSLWATPRTGGVDESWQTAEKRGKTSNLYAQIDKIQKAKNWGTPKEQDSRAAMNDRGKSNLGEQVHGIHNYPTPRTSDAEGGRIETIVEDGVFKSKRHKSNQTFGAKLRDAVETMEEKNWATPIANDAKGSDYAGTKENPKGLYLSGQVKKEENWATPRASATDSTRPNGKGGIPLADQVKKEQNWPTPATRDYKGVNSIKHCQEKPRHNGQLPNAVMLNDLKKDKNWPTPRARDWKDTPGCAPSKIGDVSLPRKINGLQDPTTPNMNGKNQESFSTPKTSPPLKTASQKGRLNPSWVEQLMGLPVGWTQIESID